MSTPHSQNPEAGDTQAPEPKEGADATQHSKRPTAPALMNDDKVDDDATTTSTTNGSPPRRSGESTNSGSNNAEGDSVKRTSGGKRTMLLLLLLIVSVVVNVFQAQQSRRSTSEYAQIHTALDGAMERIDQETSRANHAEAELTEIDRSVSNVQERIAELQSALAHLAEISER